MNVYRYRLSAGIFHVTYLFCYYKFWHGHNRIKSTGQINGQWLNCDEKNALTTNFILLKSIQGVILEMTFHSCAAFSKILHMRDWKVNLQRKNTPNNFSHILLLFTYTCQFSIIILVFKLELEMK